MVGMACDIATARQPLSFAVVLGVLLGLVGWSLLAAAGPARGWVALLWLTSAAGLVPALTTSADRRDTTTHRLGVAGLLATGASGLVVVLATGLAGMLAVPFLPLLIAYTTLLITTGAEAPTHRAQRQISLSGLRTRASALLGASEVTAKETDLRAGRRTTPDESPTPHPVNTGGADGRRLAQASTAPIQGSRAQHDRQEEKP
jgi:hypothetical protein